MKYNPLEFVPYGLIATKSWLMSQGITRHTLDNWVKSGQLHSIAYGVYKRPDTKLTWQGVVSSLQRMGSDLCPGGITALSLQGLGQYSELGQHKVIHLYGWDRLPVWANKLLGDVTFIHHAEQQLLGNTLSGNKRQILQEFTTKTTWGLEEWPLHVSMPERAWFEVLLNVPEKISFEHADQLIQGLVNLSPQRLNTLMTQCSNIKVRRLFLWFAERHRHAWFKKIEMQRFTWQSGLLGSGKRMLAKQGKLNPKYRITVPKEMSTEIYG